MVPTRVGMIPAPHLSHIFTMGGPHACGDDPRDPPVERQNDGVVPTRVGMILLSLRMFALKLRGPHACGDDPQRDEKGRP